MTKKVNGRSYRYRVERYRDEPGGKTKARWTYVGRGEHAPEPKSRSRAAQTRDRLVDGLCVLVEARPWDEITVDLIAQQAGVSHGTVYRHFTDRPAVLRAAIERRRTQLERERPRFEGPLRSREEERARLRAWIGSVVALPLEHPGLLRAHLVLAATDVSVAIERLQRRNAAEAALCQYLRELAAAGFAKLPQEPELFVRSLFLAFDGLLNGVARSSAFDREDLRRGVTELFDRAIFA